MNRIYKKLFTTAALGILVASQSYQVQAADNPDSGRYVQPGFEPAYQYNPPADARGNRNQQRQQYQNRQGYGGPGNYNRGYPPPPYYGDRDYRRGGRGSGFSGPWERGRGDRRMPWESRRGDRNMPWDSGRGGWMSKDKFSDAWDDMLNAPSDMGEMPGGWTAPSVSVPNPVDVGDEFEGAARDAPEQMRNVYDDNRRSNR